MGAALSTLQTHRRVVGPPLHPSAVRERLTAALAQAVSNSRSPAKELARQLHLSPNGVGKLLRGESMPRADTLIAAMRAFDEVYVAVQALADREPARAERLLDELAEKLRERRR